MISLIIENEVYFDKKGRFLTHVTALTITERAAICLWGQWYNSVYVGVCVGGWLGVCGTEVTSRHCHTHPTTHLHTPTYLELRCKHAYFRLNQAVLMIASLYRPEKMYLNFTLGLILRNVILHSLLTLYLCFMENSLGLHTQPVKLYSFQW